MDNKNQQGSVLIYCLLLLSLIAVIGFTMHSLVYMEIKMSLYEQRASQARELAEAASLLTIEEITLLLHDNYCEVYQLPKTVDLGNSLPIVFSEDKVMQTGIIALVSQNKDLCIYSFSSGGMFKGAEKTINTQVAFDFIEHYDYEEDAEGNTLELFSHRDFINRGRVVSYSEE
jgi:hypothetical protein